MNDIHIGNESVHCGGMKINTLRTVAPIFSRHKCRMHCKEKNSINIIGVFIDNTQYWHGFPLINYSIML